MTHLDDDDLRALIDGSFGDGPPERPLGELLDAGHRAVRRRRTALAGGVLAAVLAVGGGAVALSRDTTTTGSDRGEMATQGPDTTPDLAVRTVPGVPADVLLRIADDGVIEVRPGVEVLDHVDDPYDLASPDWSVAVRYVYDRDTRFALLSTVDGGFDSFANAGSASGAARFEPWVRDQVALQSAPAAEDPTRSASGEDLVELRADGTLDLLEGVEVVIRSDDPFGLDGPDSHSVALWVTFEDRVRWIAVQVRIVDGRVERGSVAGVFPDTEADPSYEDFVAEQRRSFEAGASGGGR